MSFSVLRVTACVLIGGLGTALFVAVWQMDTRNELGADAQRAVEASPQGKSMHRGDVPTSESRIPELKIVDAYSGESIEDASVSALACPLGTHSPKPEHLHYDVAAPLYTPKIVTVTLHQGERAPTVVPLKRHASIEFSWLGVEEELRETPAMLSISSSYWAMMEGPLNCGFEIVANWTHPVIVGSETVISGLPADVELDLLISFRGKQDCVFPRQLVLPSGGKSVIRLEAKPARIAGKVTDYQGRPLEGCLVLLIREADPFGFGAFAQPVKTAASDAGGHFNLDGVLPGRWLVTTAPMGDLVVEPSLLEIVDSSVINAELVLLVGGRITGIAVDDAGAPIPGASVRAFSAENGYQVQGGPTGPDGMFSVGPLLDGIYAISVSPPFDRPDLLDCEVSGLRPGSNGVRFECTKGAGVTGRLLDESGRGIPGEVFLTACGDEVKEAEWWARALADGQGAFSFSAVKFGGYRIRASGLGGRIGSADINIVGGLNQPVELRADFACSIMIKVDSGFAGDQAFFVDGDGGVFGTYAVRRGQVLKVPTPCGRVFVRLIESKASYELISSADRPLDLVID